MCCYVERGTVRLFAAVDLEARARAATSTGAASLATRLDRLDPPAVIRWVVPEQLHFTLRFLGEVSETRCGLVRSAFAVPFETSAFSATLTGADIFPFSGAPRVIWRGMGEGQDQLVALRAELDRRLASVGFEPDTKLFRAHLTIGRVGRRSRASGAALRDVLGEDRSEATRWAVDRVNLYESRLGVGGATYHLVESVVLPASLGPREPPPV